MSWRALSLWEPWASAIPAGLKTVETRSYPTRWTGDLLICSAAKVLSSREFQAMPPPVRLWGRQQLDRGGLAFGHVVAVARLVACIADQHVTWVPANGIAGDFRWGLGAGCCVVDERERPWGVYGPGRFAWLLGDVRPLHRPVLASGRQRLWIPTPELIAEALAAAA